MFLRIVMALLILASCIVDNALAAEAPSQEGAEADTEKTATESSDSQDEETKTDVATVEFRVPDGGYLTDPAVVQDEPRSSALNRLFPLWKSIAGDKALPRPWSVGVVTYWQTQNYDLVSASIGLGDLPELDLDIEGSYAFVDAKSVNVKLGLWVLPFLNLTGTAGYNVVETDIHLSNAPIGINPPGGPGRPPEIVYGERTLDLDFEGPFWAATATVVGGWKNFWGSGVVSYADAKLDASVGAIGENRFTSQRVQLNAGYNFQGVNV